MNLARGLNKVGQETLNHGLYTLLSVRLKETFILQYSYALLYADNLSKSKKVRIIVKLLKLGRNSTIVNWDRLTGGIKTKLNETNEIFLYLHTWPHHFFKTIWLNKYFPFPCTGDGLKF